MHEIELITALLIIIVLLAVVADRFKVPYPILLVLVGSAIGLVPGLPHVALPPDLVFFVFLPPLLYSAAWQTSWPDFKAAHRPIGLLALGCVLFTTTLVAAVAHYALPGFDWATAFVLGAIVSPPDAVAAAAALKGLPVPKRVLTILEGESLVNDATGLIAYRYAVAAVLTGQFALGPASLQLLWVAAAGVAIGWLLGRVVYFAHLHTHNNSVVDTSLTLLTPYVAYVVAEEAHVSGVLAVVTAGLVLSRHQARIFSHEGRLQAYAVWNALVFLLNGVVFILIGLQLPTIMEGVGPAAWSHLVGYGALISLTVVVGRLLWVYPGTYLPRWLSHRIREREPRPPVALATVIGWAGLRGVVSLAAALALPLTLPSGAPFPQRNLILLLTFMVIFVTLVLQGLSLPLLIRVLGIREDGQAGREEHALRLHLAQQTAAYLAGPAAAAQAPAEVLVRMQTRYEHRLHRLQQHLPDAPAGQQPEAPPTLTPFQQLQEAVIHFEREVLEQLRREQNTSEEALRKLENELDLEEARLTLDKG
ncbi:Na+/H+ antiporter [Hymenobacter weizhouensis]|uniref:Na+/H+ antiporter n=1 Tax=Hymenobacter sp. YIM 151500-1 TaxID=2987689 RepID=UPI002225D1BD|nr:Na+/H+ antiporter [Hymenobacter sp. YIM 151500-1]UYZ63688.1 Na+/H+ antiporter [Hymenobacter sp. YIM 151500-1]